LAAVVPIGPPCPGCAGGGEVNGLPCGECGGSTRLAPPKRRRWRRRLLRVADTAATPAGTAVGRSLASLPLLPGILGAIGLSIAAGEIAGHVFGHGLAPWVGLAVSCMFGLLLDRKL